MLNYHEKYGYCILPRGTLLFRGHTEKKISNTMFFAPNHDIASLFNNSIQIWRIVHDLKILFLVSHINSNGWCYSAVPELLKSCFPKSLDQDIDEIQIKNENIKLRNKFTYYLYYKCGINGWLSSVEGKIDIEICLLNKINISNHLTLIAETTAESKEYYKNSLRKIQIFPAPEFFIRSLLKLKEWGLSYPAYIKDFNKSLKDDAENDEELIILKNNRYNIRNKLKL